MAAPKKSAVEECTVCCEPYNKSTHAPIECEQGGCKYKACLECIRSYLLISVNEPHCMECKANWSAKFMLHLKKGWLADVYRPHREKFLCDIELSKLGETMPDAERYKAWKKQDAIAKALRKEYLERKEALERFNKKVEQAERLTLQTKNGRSVEEKADEKKEFFMPCPVVDCKGLLSTQYKCGICDHFTCIECHEVIGVTKTDAHTCDANNIASAQAIKKETKQCPGCHNRIYRVEGCSQMWCTGCHTAFDWNTGKKVVSERLHNPHWLEYQRTLNGGTAPRAPGDVPCGGVCSRNQINNQIVHKLIRAKTLMLAAAGGVSGNYSVYEHPIDKLADMLRIIHRVVENITLNEVREIRERLQTMADFKMARVRYIVGEMTKPELSAHIFKTDKIRQKNTELLNVYELLSAVGIDMFNRLLASEKSGNAYVEEVQDQIKEYNNLRAYCNGLFAIISNTYGMVVPQYTENFYPMTEKFNTKTMQKNVQHEWSASASASASS
jgi:hypothetical protein